MDKNLIEKYLKINSNQPIIELLFRDLLLTDIFANDKKEILYYYGKDLANNFTFNSIDEITTLFSRLGLGKICLEKVKKNQYLFGITGQVVSKRFLLFQNPEFALEAGFLAQAINCATKRTAEGQFQVNFKKQKVSILIQTLSH